MEAVPQEIIVDILCRLTVKDLLRYRSVSKTWRSLIDDPHFIKLHLHHSKRTKTNLGVVLPLRSDIYWVDYDTLDSAVKLHNPIDVGVKTEVLGSYNGLLALQNHSGDVALWNPSTRRYRNIPVPPTMKKTPFSSYEFHYDKIEFGYDSVTDDHKLLRITFFMKENAIYFHYEFEIYSLKANTWKRVVSGTHFSNYCFHGCACVANRLHWVSCPSNSMLSFDLVTEEFNEVSPPDYAGRSVLVWKLVELGGCLCSVCKYTYPEKEDRIDIWMMKEFGVKESWTKLYSVAPSDLSGHFYYVFPVAFSKSNDQILLDEDGKNFYLYDLEMKTAKNVKISGVERWGEMNMCVASLVGVDSTTDGEIDTSKQGKRRGMISCLSYYLNRFRKWSTKQRT